MAKREALDPPVRLVLPDGQQAVTIAAVRRYGWSLLIVMDAEEATHLVEQHADGRLLHRTGPITTDQALEAAERVLTGRETSVTADTVAAAACLVATVLRQESEPCAG